MIHTFYTDKNFKEAILGFAKSYGSFDDGWTKEEILEENDYYNEFHKEINRYAERNNLFVNIDDEKNIEEQLKELNVTYSEIIEALLKDRQSLITENNYLYKLLNNN